MSFWNLSGGETANTNTSTEFEIPSGGFEVIPAGSSVLAIIDKAAWAHKDRNDSMSPEYLELTWQVMQPESVKGRKIFHKLWVTDAHPDAKDATTAAKKRDKALRMLAAIDANAGGKLSTLNAKPTENQLGMALTNKPMVITLQVWDDNQTKLPAGNWVSAVAPKTKALELKAPAAPKPAQNNDAWSSPASNGGWSSPAQGGALDDDEIPF